MAVMRIGMKGQVTIPQSIREQLGLLPDTEVRLFVEDGTARIVKVDNSERATPGRTLISNLRGKADTGMTTDEIMALTRADP